MIKMQPGITYKMTHLEVSNEEIRRIREDFEKWMTEGARLFARLDLLIKQGNLPRKD